MKVKEERKKLVTKERTPYALDCSNCRKKSFLTPSEYAKQQQDTQHDGFTCPNCGSSSDCNFDEINYEELMGVKRRSF